MPQKFTDHISYSLTFPGSQNSLTIPGFPGLWEPCVCLSVYPLAYLKTTRLNFTKLSVCVNCAVAQSSSARQCNTLCTSGFVDDVMFAHN